LSLEGICIFLELLEKRIEEDYYSIATAIEIFSLQWRLIPLGIGVLIGSYIATPAEERDGEVLIAPFVGSLAAIVLILLIDGVTECLPHLLLVCIRNLIALLVILYCIHRAARVRNV